MQSSTPNQVPYKLSNNQTSQYEPNMLSTFPHQTLDVDTQRSEEKPCGPSKISEAYLMLYHLAVSRDSNMQTKKNYDN